MPIEMAMQLAGTSPYLSHDEVVTRMRYGQLFLPFCSLPRFPTTVWALCKGARAGELSRAPLPVKVGMGLFVGMTFTSLGTVPLWAMGSDIHGCKMWGDAVRDVVRGSRDLPPQQGRGVEEKTPSKGKGHVCPTALQPWKRENINQAMSYFPCVKYRGRGGCSRGSKK